MATLAVRIEWREGPEFPDLVKGGAVGNASGRVVHVAGMTYPWRENETGWWLDEKAGEWEPLPPLPIGLAYTTGISAGDCLFVVGGRRRGMPRADCLMLDLDRGWNWTRMPELKCPRGVPALALAGNRIHAVGGGSWGNGAFLPDNVPIDEVLDLDHPEEGWHPMPTCPGPRRANAFAAGTGETIYVFGGVHAWLEGGEQKVVRLRDAWRFDAVTGDWTELAHLPTAGLSGAAALPYADRYVIILGGAIAVEEGRGECAVDWRYDPKRKTTVGWYSEEVFLYDCRADSYSRLDGKLPWGAHDIRATILGDTVYAVGGENVDPPTSNTCAYVRVGQVRQS